LLLALFEKIDSIIADISSELAPLIEAALPKLDKLFTELREPISQVLDFLTILAKEILGILIKLVTNESFLSALGSIGKSFGTIAKNVGEFIKSPIVGFLLDLTAGVIITGLNILAAAMQAIANTFAAAVSAIQAFNSTKVIPKSIPTGGVSSYTQDNRTQKVPKFAEGGIVMPRAGGTLGIIGEAGIAEAVIPLDRLDKMTGGGSKNYNITVNAGMGADGGRIGQMIVDEIKKFERSNGPVFAGA